jgi:hypothetical protein
MKNYLTKYLQNQFWYRDLAVDNFDMRAWESYATRLRRCLKDVK